MIRCSSTVSLGIALVAACALPAHAGQASPTVDVTIDASKVEATVGGGAVGADIWFPNPNGAAPEAVRRYREAGINALGYDGGPAVDLYDWRTNSLKPFPAMPAGAKPFSPAHVNYGASNGRTGDYSQVLQPQVTFDDFGKLLRETGATGRVHVNYGTGTAEEAAEWARYSRERDYPVTHWEVGQALYVNGHFGFFLEPDAHADFSPTAYANNARTYIRSMKAVNPALKVGVGLAYARPNPGSEMATKLLAWNEAVLAAVAREIDFVSIQVYPGGLDFGPPLDDAQLLQFPATLRQWVAEVRAMLERHAGSDNKIEVIVSETSSDSGGTLRNIELISALYLPDLYLNLFAGGAQRVEWFNTHLGPMPRRYYLHGRKPEPGANRIGYGDYGLLSSGACDEETNFCQPAAHTPFAPYFGMKMLADLSAPGSKLLATESADPLVTAHAARRADGSLAILLINKDPQATRNVTLKLKGFRPAANATRIFYGRGSSDTARSTIAFTAAGAQTLPPYSLTTLILAAP